MLSVDDISELIDVIFEKKQEERAWDMWISVYPQMNKDNFVKFSEFYKKQTNPVTTQSAEDILREAEEIQKKVLNKKQADSST